jgi:hypothetical protein
MKYMVCIVMVFIMSGCGTLRFAPGEAQKENAWLHGKTAEFAAQTATTEHASDQLQKLTALSATQSQAFVQYYGMPDTMPEANSPEAVLSEPSQNVSRQASIEAAARPGGWDVADNLFELGLGIAGVFGGVYGTRISTFLADAKQKSQALREIVQGNELFKTQNPAAADAFKDAHKDQSTETRQIVAALK